MNHTCLWIGILLFSFLIIAAHALFKSVRHSVEWSLLRPLERIAQRLFEIESQLRLANHHRQIFRTRVEGALQSQNKK